MSHTVISVEHLSKSYILRHQKRESYVALRDVLTNKTKSFFRKKNNDGFISKEEFLALDDISFEVKQGERVGIIGRNGAGKSTLLKVLSRIVTPTKGQVVLEGRVASLLEVGTGFHPELTGSENIFLNGSILGMGKAEIKSKFDEIVEFSGVEKFLDTPVKRFSSGMYVRLAFAVAAHLETEILIVDEVLAVGDAEFQKKCLGKMSEVSKSGRTILFVSHNLPSVKVFCNKGMLLRNGKMVTYGNVDDAINHYLNTNKNELSKISCLISDKFRRGNYTRDIEILFVELENPIHDDCFASDLPLKMRVQIKGNRNQSNCRIAGSVFNNENAKLGTFFGEEIISIGANQVTDVYLQLINHNLSKGFYSISLSIGKGSEETGNTEYDIVYEVLTFQISYKRDSKSPIVKWAEDWGNFSFKTITTLK